MGRAISIGGLQGEHDLPGTVESKALVGDGGAGDIAAQVFEFSALLGATAHLGMQAEAVRIGTQCLRGLRRSAGRYSSEPEQVDPVSPGVL